MATLKHDNHKFVCSLGQCVWRLWYFNSFFLPSPINTKFVIQSLFKWQSLGIRPSTNNFTMEDFADQVHSYDYQIVCVPPSRLRVFYSALHFFQGLSAVPFEKYWAEVWDFKMIDFIFFNIAYPQYFRETLTWLPDVQIESSITYELQ